VYDGHSSNPCRFEDAEAAIASGNLLKALWANHPNLVFVDAFERLEQKIGAVTNLL
jgi:hypothetical protein